MNSQGENNVEEKPEYGLYVGYSVIAFFILVGLGGIILFVFGFFVDYYLNRLLWSIGILLLIVFLWPGIGFLFIANRSMYKQETLNISFLQDFHEAQILDCGCGTGRHAIPLAKQMTKSSFLTGIDIYDEKSISINSLERVQKNAEIEGVADRTKFMAGSVTDIPFDNETFDIVTCMGVIHELRNENERTKAFQEIYRVLKSDGAFYFRELKRISLFLGMGIFALLAFKSEAYWENELIKNKFKIIDRFKERNYHEFLAKKMTMNAD